MDEGLVATAVERVRPAAVRAHPPLDRLPAHLLVGLGGIDHVLGQEAPRLEVVGPDPVIERVVSALVVDDVHQAPVRGEGVEAVRPLEPQPLAGLEALRVEDPEARVPVLWAGVGLDQHQRPAVGGEATVVAEHGYGRERPRAVELPPLVDRAVGGGDPLDDRLLETEDRVVELAARIGHPGGAVDPAGDHGASGGSRGRSPHRGDEQDEDRREDGSHALDTADGRREVPAGDSHTLRAVRIFSGIQPTGRKHLGNYIGAIRQYVIGQDRGEAIYCIVDLHAISVAYDPAELRERLYDTTAILLAAGAEKARAIAAGTVAEVRDRMGIGPSR